MEPPIRYQREGSGLPVILLHGGWTDSRMWEPQVRDFARHFEVIRPDLRRFGESDGSRGAPSAVADVVGLMDLLHEKPAHVVGASIGAQVAIDFALQHGERISRLVLAGPLVAGFRYSRDDEPLIADLGAARAAPSLDPPAIGRLHEITAPALVVVGDHDARTVFDMVELLMEKIPRARKAVIHDAGHVPSVEQPHEFNRVVLEFLLSG